MVLHCLDGSCVAEASAVLPADSALVRFGEGWFETLRIERGRAMFLEAHRTRLHRSVQAAGYDSHQPLQLFDATAAALVAAHRERSSSDEETPTIGRLRILVTPRDSGGWSALGRCEPYAPPVQAYRSGLRASIASLPHPQWGRIGKSASYHWSIMARREAFAVIRDWLTEAESALVRGDLKKHFECLQEGLDVLTSLRGLEQ